MRVRFQNIRFFTNINCNFRRIKFKVLFWYFFIECKGYLSTKFRKKYVEAFRLCFRILNFSFGVSEFKNFKFQIFKLSLPRIGPWGILRRSRGSRLNGPWVNKDRVWISNVNVHSVFLLDLWSLILFRGQVKQLDLKWPRTARWPSFRSLFFAGLVLELVC